MAMFIDRTGETHGQFQIVQELRAGEVLCECIKCGNIDKYNKANIVRLKVACNSCGNKPVDKTGEVYRDLQIVKELGKKMVSCRCIKCGHLDNYSKYHVTRNSALCKNCGTKNISDRTGEIHGTLRIEKELRNNKVECVCLQCGYTDTYVKADLGRQTVLCKNCGTKYKDRSNEVYNDLKIVEELGNHLVRCICTICGEKDIYNKDNIVHSKLTCRACGIGKNYRGKVINNVKLIDYAYKGRDGNNYYNCKCIKCGEGLILIREEIVKYICSKG